MMFEPASETWFRAEWQTPQLDVVPSNDCSVDWSSSELRRLTQPRCNITSHITLTLQYSHTTALQAQSPIKPSVKSAKSNKKEWNSEADDVYIGKTVM